MVDKVLQGLEGVLCYIDDILVSSEDEASHFQLLGKYSLGWNSTVSSEAGKA